MKFLQAYAEQTQDNKSSLTISVLKLGKESYSKTEYVYVIPTDSGKLEKSAEVLFSDPDPIVNIDKKNYNEKIVFDFLNLNKESIDYEQVNLNYRQVLTSNILGSDSSVDFFSQNSSLIQEEVNSSIEQTKKNLEEYEASAPENIDEILEEYDYDPDDDSDEHLDESDITTDLNEYSLDEYIFDSPEGLQGNLQTNLNMSQANLNQIGYNPNEVELSKATNINGGSAADLPATNKPKGLNSAPVFDLAGQSQGQAEKYGLSEDIKQTYLNGVGGGRLIEPVPKLDAKPGDGVLQSENNSGIIATRDELYKIRGHTKAGAVYMFAGRSPNSIVMEKPAEGDGPPTPVVKPNDMISDAAYVYLSQKSDVDNLLRVAGGTYSKVISRHKEYSPTETRQGISLAAIKADDVTIMSRVSGIRLITGMDDKNSSGGEQFASFGIDLIAGNEDQDLQPLVKGDNLKKYLENLSKSVGQVAAILLDFIQTQFKFNSVLSSHTHYDPFLILLGFMSTNGANPLAFNRGKGYISIKAQDAGRTATLNNIIQISGCKSAGQNRVNNDTSAFSDLGSYKILSEKNRTN